jgi:hypothetical protein
MVFGSLLHLMILEPHKFNERYASFQGTKPNSANASKFCNYIADGLSPVDAYEKSYSTAKKKPDVIRNEANEKYSDYCGYINCLIEAKGKVFIENSDIEKVEKMLKELSGHPYFATIQKYENNKNVIILREKVIFWKDPKTGIECKAKLDELILDPINNKVIYNDYKSTAKFGAEGFVEAVKTYRYDRQGAFYSNAIIHSGILEELGFNTDNIDFEVCIIAMCTREPFTVNTYRFHHETMIAASDEILEDLMSLKSKLSTTHDSDTWQEQYHNPNHFIIKKDEIGNYSINQKTQ